MHAQLQIASYLLYIASFLFQIQCDEGSFLPLLFKKLAT